MSMSDKQPIEFDSNGTIINRGIHDSEVMSITKNSDDSFSFNLTTQSNVNLELKLNGIKRLVINNMWVQNIILDIFLFKGSDIKKEIEDNPKFFNFRSDELNSMNFDELYYVQIAPSNGLEMVAICKSVELFEI
jgi:hypothetical protein